MKNSVLEFFLKCLSSIIEWLEKIRSWVLEKRWPPIEYEGKFETDPVIQLFIKSYEQEIRDSFRGHSIGVRDGYR